MEAVTEGEYIELLEDDRLPDGHSFLFSEDPMDEHNRYCECGKWIELGTYDHWDHLTSIGH